MFVALWNRLTRPHTRRKGRPARRRPWFVRPAVEFLEERLAPAMTYTVTNLSDAVVPPVGLDLRQAVNAANTNPGSTIVFGAGVSGTITLEQGDLDITAPVTINATGHSIAISGAGRDRVFDIGTAGTVNLTGLTIKDGRAPTASSDGGGNGGGVYDSNPASILNLSNDNVLLNFASGTGSGGGVYSNGIVNLSGTRVEANNAPNHGGGVYAAKDLSLTNSTVTDNVAGDGGGLYESGTGTTVTLLGSTVQHNRATRGNGGGVWAQFNVSATRSTVANNVALGGTGVSNGGGIYSDGGNVTLSATTVSGNTATGEGGGVFADYDVFVMAGSTVRNNISNGGGGGIWSDDGFVDIANSSVSNNTAGAGTAGAAGNGGGVWSGTDVLLTGGTISGNIANGNGGGIFALRSVTLSAGTTVTGNAAVSTTGANGSGGGVFAVLDVTVTGSTVSANTADLDGGGIHAAGNVYVTASATVSGNFAGRDGGGIWGGPTSNILIDPSTVTGNTANHNGGGVFLAGSSEGVEETGSLFLTDSTISNNFALNEGGGVYVDTVEAVTILGASITGNTSALSGGGVSSHGVFNLSITGTTLSGNQSLSGSGGGLYATGGPSNVYLDTDSFLGNTAGVSGGGAYLDVPDATLNNVTFDNNVSYGGPTTGSALFVNSGVADLNNSVFHDTLGNSALLSTDLIDVASGAILLSSGGNHVIDSSWVNITGFNTDFGDVPNGL